jgi:hypothetical protein
MPLQTRQIGKRAKESLSAWDAATKKISCFFGLLRCGEIPGLDVLAAHESCVHAVVEAICVGIPALRPAHRLDSSVSKGWRCTVRVRLHAALSPVERAQENLHRILARLVRRSPEERLEGLPDIHVPVWIVAHVIWLLAQHGDSRLDKMRVVLLEAIICLLLCILGILGGQPAADVPKLGVSRVTSDVGRKVRVSRAVCRAVDHPFVFVAVAVDPLSWPRINPLQGFRLSKDSREVASGFEGEGEEEREGKRGRGRGRRRETRGKGREGEEEEEG